jgi:hypothetical protein
VYIKFQGNGITALQSSMAVEAAMQVFIIAKLHPHAAYSGYWARQSWDGRGFPENDPSFTDAQSLAATVWDDANLAAIKAVFGENFSNWPEDAELLPVFMECPPG